MSPLGLGGLCTGSRVRSSDESLIHLLSKISHRCQAHGLDHSACWCRVSGLQGCPAVGCESRTSCLPSWWLRDSHIKGLCQHSPLTLE